MGFKYHKSRVDANHSQIVTVAKRLGCVVLDTSPLKNCFDLLIAYRGQLFCVEIKDGSKPKNKRALTSGEADFKNKLESVDVPYFVVETVEDLFKILNSK